MPGITPYRNGMVRSNALVKGFIIPEPTRSLLWTSNEDPSKATSPMTIKISFDLNTGDVDVGAGNEGNLFSEPSLIWTRLPVEKNSELENKPMYYPSYAQFTAKNRYQYLNWLLDISRETNLSYVFLYYYGLERHLLIGSYDTAVEEILRLLSHHDRGTFRNYAIEALLVSSIYHHRLDILDRAPFLKDEITNEALLVRLWSDKHIEPIDIARMAQKFGFRHSKYLKDKRPQYLKTISDAQANFENNHGRIFSYINPRNLTIEKRSVFANYSIPDKARIIEIPQLLDNEIFRSAIRSILLDVSDRMKTRMRKS